MPLCLRDAFSLDAARGYRCYNLGKGNQEGYVCEKYPIQYRGHSGDSMTTLKFLKRIFIVNVIAFATFSTFATAQDKDMNGKSRLPLPGIPIPKKSVTAPPNQARQS